MYLGKKHKVQLAAVETENPMLKKRQLKEDNTIDIVCLDETSSSSNLIQSADSENSEIDIDNYIQCRHSLFVLLYVTVYVNLYFCLNFILKGALFKINFNIMSALIIILVATRILFNCVPDFHMVSHVPTKNHMARPETRYTPWYIIGMFGMRKLRYRYTGISEKIYR